MSNSIKVVINLPMIFNPAGYYPERNLVGEVTEEQFKEIKKLGVDIKEVRKVENEKSS